MDVHEDRLLHPGRRAGLFFAVLAAAALAVMGYLAAIVIYSADDFWYITFFDNGLRDYIELMRLHYRIFNGRVLVHVAAQIILFLGSRFFTVVCLALCVAVPVFSGLSARKNGWELVLALALFSVGLLCMPYSVICQGILWISAFCNYMLPSAMLCGALLLFRWAREYKGRLPGPALLCMIYAFLCGATTEQSGLSALVLMLYYLFEALLKRGKGRIWLFLSVVCCGGGLATIFQSPATKLRFQTETHLDFWQELITYLRKSMGSAAEILTENWGFAALLAVLFLLVGVLARRQTGRKWPLIPAAAAAAAALASLFCAGQALIDLYFVLALLALGSAVTLLALGRESAGLLVLLALASACVILLTASVGGRTLLPSCLYLLAAVSVLGTEMLSGLRPAWRYVLPTVLFCAALVTVFPTVKGCIYNKQMDEINNGAIRAAHETGVIYYCLDYDMRYTGLKLNMYFSSVYLAREGLSEEEVRIIFYSGKRPNIYMDGELAGYPVREVEDASLWLPLRTVIEARGGTIASPVDYEHLVITLPWREYTMNAAGGQAVFSWTAEDGTIHEVEAKRILEDDRTWFEPWVYSDIFGFTVLEEPEQNAVLLISPE